MLEFLKDTWNYEDRKIGKEQIGGLQVSTAYTSDEGYETAIIDQNGVYPVERYTDKQSAVNGHSKWLKKAENLTFVTMLGGLVPEEEITLVQIK